jgi:Gp49-like protein DUF891
VADIRKQFHGEERPEADLQGKRVRAVFYRTEAGGEPVREWLKRLPSREDRRRIGEDIKTARVWLAGGYAGMPLRRRWYSRGTVGLAQNRIARVLFYFDKSGRMVLLHGFIKKTRKTPDEDLDLAQLNKKKHERLQ